MHLGKLEVHQFEDGQKGTSNAPLALHKIKRLNAESIHDIGGQRSLLQSSVNALTWDVNEQRNFVLN